jgi:hypothetical protein
LDWAPGGAASARGCGAHICNGCSYLLSIVSYANVSIIIIIISIIFLDSMELYGMAWNHVEQQHRCILSTGTEYFSLG